MARVRDTVYTPIPANQATYDVLYREYVRLHDLFGRGGDDVMRNLKSIQLRVSEAERPTWPASSIQAP